MSEPEGRVGKIDKLSATILAQDTNKYYQARPTELAPAWRKEDFGLLLGAQAFHTRAVTIWTDPFKQAGFAGTPASALASWRGDSRHTQLTPDEKSRLARLKDERGRAELEGSLMLRRALIGALVKTDANQIELGAEADGAPLLVRPAGYSVSISNKGSWTLVALDAAPCAIGVDVELVRKIDWRAMLDMVCAEEERDSFVAGQADKDAERNFFRMWTVKEAILKATGAGFRAGPKHVRVPDALYGDAAIGRVEAFGAAFDLWALQESELALSIARRAD